MILQKLHYRICAMYLGMYVDYGKSTQTYIELNYISMYIHRYVDDRYALIPCLACM
jgi:hypothetical protein